VTLKEIAKELGISAMTVSRALNNKANVAEKTRKRVIEMARKMGYKPNYIAKSLVLNKTFTIGVVVPEITHSFFTEVIRGIEEVVSQSGYQLILTHSAEDWRRERKAIYTLEAKRVDGILISIAQTVTDYDLYRQLVRSDLPLVFFDRCVFGIGASCVSIDNELSARQVTQHLIQHGYKKIAHLSGPQKVSIGKFRLQGFQKALRESGIPIDPKWIVECGFHEEGGYIGMRQLLKLPAHERPRAVVAVSNPVAFGAIQAILEAGLRIPEDVALVGFSDDVLAPLMPVPLTTVRQPVYEMGRRAAQKLIDIIEGRSTDVEEIVVKADLVIRESCGCKKKAF